MSRYIGNGVKVKGLMGNPSYSGTVLSSRYIGNELMYEVLLDTPLQYRWRDKPTEVILLSDNDIEVALVGETI